MANTDNLSGTELPSSPEQVYDYGNLTPDLKNYINKNLAKFMIRLVIFKIFKNNIRMSIDDFLLDLFDLKHIKDYKFPVERIKNPNMFMIKATQRRDAKGEIDKSNQDKGRPLNKVGSTLLHILAIIEKYWIKNIKNNDSQIDEVSTNEMVANKPQVFQGNFGSHYLVYNSNHIFQCIKEIICNQEALKKMLDKYDSNLYNKFKSLFPGNVEDIDDYLFNRIPDFVGRVSLNFLDQKYSRVEMEKLLKESNDELLSLENVKGNYVVFYNLLLRKAILKGSTAICVPSYLAIKSLLQELNLIK